jgi:hypothetical protein
MLGGDLNPFLGFCFPLFSMVFPWEFLSGWKTAESSGKKIVVNCNQSTYKIFGCGKSLSEDRPSRCFGFVQTYDEKPKRRLFELLKGQGMQIVMFFSDGGTDIREVQQYLNPEAEHYLDWFHITMRLTVMGQYAKGLDTTQENRQVILKLLESVKHYLWHGNVSRARDRIQDIHCFLDSKSLAERTVANCKRRSTSSIRMSLSTRHSFRITGNAGVTRNRSRRALWNRL